MAIYTFKCPICSVTTEVIQKFDDNPLICYNHVDVAGYTWAIEMERVLDTPAAPQWNCTSGHSRSKGF